MMRTLLTFILSTVLVMTTVLSTAPPAQAEETTCRGTMGARTVDNLRVPQGKSCTLNGTRIKGTLKVERGATLNASNIRVTGNVQAENHKYVSLVESIVGGSVQFDQGGAFRVTTTRVVGSIQVKANSGQSLLRSNRVNQDIQVFNHRNGIGIRANRIDGNLQCKANSPAPTGGGNIVQGNKEDQCKRL
jgi:hypothetical protein